MGGWGAYQSRPVSRFLHWCRKRLRMSTIDVTVNVTPTEGTRREAGFLIVRFFSLSFSVASLLFRLQPFLRRCSVQHSTGRPLWVALLYRTNEADV